MPPKIGTLNAEVNAKTKVLLKLFESGCKTEKDLQDLDIENILKIKNVTINDMKTIIEIKKQTKANKLFSFLGGGLNDGQGAK